MTDTQFTLKELAELTAKMEQALKIILVWSEHHEEFGDDKLALQRIADRAKEALKDG